MEYIRSKYTGSKNSRNEMHGFGEYTFPTRSAYKGGFKNGKFHGGGMLYLTNGTEFRGTWKDGEVDQGRLLFSDGLDWQARDWDYCKDDDRRFHSERLRGLQPAGLSQLTDKQPPPKIPPGCYDAGDGFYDHKTRIVTNYKLKFLRYANNEEHEWIVMKCRKGWDEIVGKQSE